MKNMNVLKGLFTILFVASLGLITNVYGGEDPYALRLKFGNINLHENADSYLKSFEISDQEVVEGLYHKIIQFYEIPTSQEKQILESKGIKFLDYIPNRAYTVAIPKSFDMALFADFNLRNISDIVLAYKLDMYLLDKNYPSYALRDNNKIELIISWFSSLNYQLALESLKDFETELVQDDAFAHTTIIQASIKDIEKIAALPAVQFVEPIYPPSEPENYTGKTLHRSNVLDSEYEMGRHYDGTGVNIMLQDDGIIGPHADYEGRLLDQFLTYNGGDHGDHCAGIIFGAGNIDPKTTGQAPGANIYMYGAAPTYPGFTSIPSHYGLYDIRISSTSYSNGCNAGYTSLARTMDIQVNTYESLMHVFSAGNDGGSNCGYGAGPGWGNVTGGHKIAKNVVAVANLNYYDILSSSSSRGPAHDGRIKPDISAKGSDVYSTTNPHDYTFKSGTSMSCPGVSGSLAQLYQAYKELNSGDEPKGGLMKALILNTADDLGNTGPDFKYGWGRINNLKAVVALEEDRYIINEISQDGIKIHIVPVPDNVKELKVMVYWTDREASIATNKALVNDLDIYVTDPSNEIHMPWLLSHYPDPDSLDKPAIKGTDHLNNVEQVSILNPGPGNYELRIDGYEVPFGPQEYYVIYEYIKDEITVTYPIGGETLPPSETATLRWDAFGDEGTFTIEYSTDGGNNWTEITSDVNGSLRHYNWNVANEITGHAKVRISRNGLVAESPGVFSVMEVPGDITYERACVNSVLIKWETVSDAVSYDVYQLGDKYMEIVGSSSTDSLLVEGISYEEEYWFAVRAVGPDEAYSRRTIAKMKEPGVWNCLFSKDLAISHVISPPTGVIFDCQDLSEISPQILITNAGQEEMTGITAYFQFDDEPELSENIDGTLQPGESIIHVFDATYTISSIGIYDVKAWIETPDDENISNNEIEGVCKVKNTQYLSAEENFDFDEFDVCDFAPDCDQVDCYINNAWFNFQNNLNDDIDWRMMNGITPTPETGPVGDHTTGTIEGKFLYLEPSGECYNKEAILTTPCVNLSSLTNPALSFWFNMFGEDMGSLHVDVVSDGILFPDVMVPLSGNYGAEWIWKFVDLSDFADKDINIRFRGYTGNGEKGDMAIDDIMFTEMTGVNEITLSDVFKVYPNPSEGKFHLLLQKPMQQEVRIQVMDVTGRVVYEGSDLDEKTAGTEYVISLDRNSPGIYYLVIRSGNEVYNEKLLKY
ncbi:MAG: S8 family serine peptidase [Bacteroidales bacterium]|nr:S8 family serine peptidase [Bacteroidales bacterium]